MPINDITAVIPVKGNSERVKKKNLRKFADLNLFEIKLRHLKKTSCFNRIVISSENSKILKTAEKYGFETHTRNPKYSTSHIPMSEVYSYIASEVRGEFIAWINVTNPLADHLIYEEAVKRFNSIKNQNYDCLLSSVKNQQNFFYKNKPVNFNSYPWPRSQDLEPLISLSFIINILNRNKMVRWGSCVGNKPYFFMVNQIISLDIDDANSFYLSELIYKNKSKFIKKSQYFC
jgi:CMP-N-acetylneuraminic acid synthetase